MTSPRREARIRLEALAGNVEVLRRTVAPAQLMAVVKADAYGHGALAVARTAVEAGDVDPLEIRPPHGEAVHQRSGDVAERDPVAVGAVYGVGADQVPSLGVGPGPDIGGHVGSTTHPLPQAGPNGTRDRLVVVAERQRLQPHGVDTGAVAGRVDGEDVPGAAPGGSRPRCLGDGGAERGASGGPGRRRCPSGSWDRPRR